MQTITSFQNERIKRARYIQTAKGREETGCFWVEGKRLVQEALENHAAIDTLIVRKEDSESHAEWIRQIEAQGKEVLCVDARLMERLCDAKTPQGIAAVVRRPVPKECEREDAYIVVLDHVQDPGNMGTILRTAQAFGCSCAVLGEGCTDPYAPKCMRAGMGAQFKLQIISKKEISKYLTNCREAGYSVIGGHLNGDSVMPALADRRVCVIGSEAHGMEEQTARACTGLYRIPMPGGAESLNAGVAAGILMFELFING